MTSPRNPRNHSSALTLTLLLTFVATLHPQQPTPNTLQDPSQQPTRITQPPAESATVKETDLLRKDGFRTARQATLSLHLQDRNGQPAPPLRPQDFKLFVNGTERPGRLQSPDGQTPLAPPLVLLVFPPNQPVIHTLAIKRATTYFSSLPLELMPWKVALLDSDGSSTAYTDGRSQLLAWLEASDRKNLGFQYATWLPRAETAVSIMSTYQGPTILLAFNPLAGSASGLRSSAFEYGGPDTLIQIAQSIGARIYIANVGGPEIYQPTGDAALHFASGISGAYNAFAFRQSRQTGQDTLGGFSNSFEDLARQIHHDLDDNYSLTFDLTAEDRDKGIPQVEVHLADKHQHLQLANLFPRESLLTAPDRPVTKEFMAALFKAARHPTPSSDFSIVQHVDYFPIRGGLQPVLPMSALVEFKGAKPLPSHLSVAEYVQNVTLDTTVLEREVESRWAGEGITWERDGHLYPGKYLWRVVLHDDAGKILASSDQKINVGIPPDPSLSLSSLVIGKSCRQITADSLIKRQSLTPEEQDQMHFNVDPMKAADCRLKPEPASRFSRSDSLRTFLRLYPTGKLGKREPNTWTATFSVRSSAGVVESTLSVPFTTDSGSGLLASVELPLNAPETHPGPHTVQVTVKGPGIRKELTATRTIEIDTPSARP